MKNSLLLVLLLLTGIYRVSAQELSYKHFTTDDGLPSSEVYDVFQDSKGFIWMATDHGLAMFDGYSFKTFNTDNGLPDNTIFKIKEDYKGILWVQTFSKGIYSFNGKEFKPHPQNDWIIKKSKRKSIYTYELCGDTLLLNIILEEFGCTAKDTFLLWSINDRKIYSNQHLYFNYLLASGKKAVFSLAEYSLNEPRTAINKPIYSAAVNYNGNNYGNLGFLPLSGNNMAAYIDNHLYLLNNNDTTGKLLRKFDNRLISMFQTSSGKLWLGFYKGGAELLDTYNSKTKTELHFLDPYSVTGILEDREGNYWFSTLEAGVFFVPGIHFRSIILDALGTNTIATKALSLLPTPTELLIGSDKNRLYSLSPSSHLTSREYNDIQSRIEDIIVRNNKVQTSGYYGNINFACKCYAAPLALDTLPGKNRLVAGTHQGFAIIDDDKTVYCSFNHGFSIRTPTVRYVAGQGIFLGTNEGLYLYKDSSINYYFSDSLLHDIRVTDLKRTTSGWLVIASRGKGMVLTKGTKRIQLTEADGMISNLLECIYPENDSSFWIGTYSGLSHLKFNPDGKSKPVFINYTRKDGLSSNEINDIDFFNGEIWLATNNGLCHFKESLIEKKQGSFPIYLTLLTINGQTQDTSALQHLKYNENNIVFEMTGLDYKALGEITYNYVVEGKNSFSGTSRLRRISFFAMEPGDYKVRITAKSSIGDTSVAPFIIRFTIPKHYTQTTWFAVLIIVLVVLIVLLIVYLYYQNRQIKAETMLQVMEAEQAALRSQMNPHFIFNVLNSIQSFLGDNDRKQAQNFLGKFSQLIRRILENSKHPFITLEEEIQSLQLYLQLEKMRFEDKVSYTFEISPEIRPGQLKVPPMMIQPMIENAILHGITPSGRSGIIEVKFAMENNMLICTIRDNGVGLSAKKEQKNKFHESTAVNNLKKRIELINQMYGTSANVIIKEIYDNGVTSGTEAKLSFPLKF
ncbi:MAG: histidine kinase [Chitinophagales bacterium]